MRTPVSIEKSKIPVRGPWHRGEPRRQNQYERRETLLRLLGICS